MVAALHWTLYGLAAVLAAVGVVGCVVPVLPGPLAVWAGVLCLQATPMAPGWGVVAGTGLVAGIATVMDTLVPGWGAKQFKCSKWGVWGSVLGALAGVAFFPWGLLAGPFLGAVAGELLAGRRTGAAVLGGIGALLGFLCGVCLKLAACALILWGALFDPRSAVRPPNMSAAPPPAERPAAQGGQEN